MDYRIYGCWFGLPFKRLSRVWEKSIRVHCPTADFKSVKMIEPEGANKADSHLWSNTAKLELWRDEVHRAVDDGIPLVLMDADTFVLGDLAPAFDEVGDAHLGYTVRDYNKIPFNNGVVFVRPTEESKMLIDEWVKHNMWYMSDPHRRGQAIREAAGVNQAAFGRLLSKSDPNWFAKLQCRVWNSVNQTWKDFDKTTRVVHVKSRLRQMVLKTKTLGELEAQTQRKYKTMSRELEPLVSKFLYYENMMDKTKRPFPRRSVSQPEKAKIIQKEKKNTASVPRYTL